MVNKIALRWILLISEIQQFLRIYILPWLACYDGDEFSDMIIFQERKEINKITLRWILVDKFFIISRIFIHKQCIN